MKLNGFLALATERQTVDRSLLLFVRQFAGVVCATLVPVVVLAFLSMPLTLGRHPGEAEPAAAGQILHMT